MLFRSEINKGYDDIGGQTFEVVASMHTVKSFGQEGREMRAFETKNQSWFDLNLQRAKKRSMYVMGRYTIMDFARVVILIMASFKALDGQITPGDILLYVTYISYVILPLNNLTWLYDDAQEAMKSVDDIMAFLETKQIGRAHV